MVQLSTISLALLGSVLITVNAQSTVPNPVLYWTDVIISAITTPTPGPSSPLLARYYALVYGSIWDATLSADSQPKDSNSDVLQKASISYAAHYGLSKLFPNNQRAYDSSLNGYIKNLTSGGDFKDTLSKAKSVGIASARADDGAFNYVAYNSTGNQTIADPGVYIATPASNLWPPVSPGGRYIKPFIVPNISTYLLPPPPALNSAEYLGNVTEVNTLGQQGSENRTAADTTTAYYWLEPTATRFNKIARILIANAGNDFDVKKTARTFALLNFALIDASISVWDAKYQYNAWRPISLFRSNSTFLKDNTKVTNETWVPLLNTPDHPEYPSNHAAVGRAAVTVLQKVLGTDTINLNFTLNITTDNFGVVSRQYTSLNTISNDNARSRIFGGIHLAFSDTLGQKLGKQIAEFVIAEFEKDQTVGTTVSSTSGANGRVGVFVSVVGTVLTGLVMLFM
ncbi:hypothetical protein HK098_007860 [Nowakowskiella sp. JEL0407]|nr:hypothetical protein HK098_007860 [Nowakowskiella sp. JEL0407]